MATSIHIDAAGPGRIFEGIGGVTSNGMTKLLREYPAPQRRDILDFLFRPKFGASLHVLKVEIGSDANGTCGTEPSHMRAADDYDITRGVGLWLAREAKKCNPALLLDAIRWGTPAFIKSYEDKYLYYKSFLDGAKREFGLEFDYLAPDENEGAYSRHWVVNVLQPRLAAEGYGGIKLTGADSTTDWNITKMIAGDAALKSAIHAVSRHYQQHSPDDAKSCGLPLYANEDIVPFRHDFSYSLDMAHKMVQSYASGRMVQYQMHPVIEAIYDDVPYTCKSILTAAHPWSGHYNVEKGLWVTAQFTQFMQPGWRYLDAGCQSGEATSSLTLTDPATGAYSIVLLNRGGEAAEYSFTVSGLAAVPALHAWATDEAVQFRQLADVPVLGGAFTVALPPRTVFTLTTTTGQQKGRPAAAVPKQTSFPLPYEDDFESYPLGKQPRYTVDQSGAFEVHPGGRQGGHALRQVITKALKPIDWERRVSPSPYTVLGGQEWANYEAGIDFYMEPIEEEIYEGFVMLGVRCNFSPASRATADSYNVRVFRDGVWQLRKAAELLQSGILQGFTPESWHSLRLAVRQDEIQLFYDEALLATARDSWLPSGHVVIGSGYNVVRYDNFFVRPVDGETPVECQRYDDTDPRITYTGTWGNDGANSNNFNRTLHITREKGAALELAFHGTGISLLSRLSADCGRADITLDGKRVHTADLCADPTQHRKSIFSAYGLPPGRHSLRLVATGEKSENAGGTAVTLDAVEVIGGEGLLVMDECVK